ncbi:MAG: putative nuclease of putative toxin-antitoxin system [Salibacteraceae bacterium]|jgi:predicted nuclease of predicted toxin-antitoxin system
MKLLIDQNFSKKLIQSLTDIFPGSEHVSSLGLEEATDHDIWKFALEKDMVLISTDTGFFNYSILAEKAPKTIYISGDIITTNKLEWILRINHENINGFINEDPSVCLTIQG